VLFFVDPTSGCEFAGKRLLLINSVVGKVSILAMGFVVSSRPTRVNGFSEIPIVVFRPEFCCVGKTGY